MKPVANWRAVLRQAWSIRLIILAGFLSGLEIFLPLIDGLFDIPRGLFAGLSALTTMGAFVARIIAQKDMNDEQKS